MWRRNRVTYAPLNAAGIEQVPKAVIQVQLCTTLLMRTRWEGTPSLEHILLLQPEAGYHYTIVYSVPRVISSSLEAGFQ